MDIPKAYNPHEVEDSIYERWKESGFFNPDNLPGKRKESFTISMPPPNATGTLHIGHAEFITIQDLVARYQRMQGKKVLWLPGTDHAAIATQSKVEKILQEKEGKTRHDLGREKFLEKVDAFVANSQSIIRNQISKMGSSCDWSRERFTLDEGLSHAVRTAFKNMYDDGLIYRGHRIVNWDPNLQTTVSDDEVEYIDKQEPFYYLQYGPFEIATSRPETKFGDKYVVMHPSDKRYANYKHGDTFECEWINGKITATVIKDESIDMELGTGVMTITPWHDLTDFDIAERHKLDKEQVIDFDGKLLPIAGEFAGLDIKEARKKIIIKLKDKGLVTKIDENYKHNIATNSRGGGVIEPQIKEQWFVSVDTPVKKFGGKSIKQKALEVVQNGEIEIIPDRFSKVYYHWLENLRDWCISRQIWYGHQVPAWYRTNDKGERETFVGTEAPEGEGWQQDPDTLDTWFSSGLWTFSTLGWPEKTKDLKTFHPTSLMETGYDILFFWVARMIIMSTYHMEQVPFKQVYLHGLIRDDQGRKMSKSLDNIIDPLDMIKSFGTDAVRLSLMIGITPGNDMNLSEEKISGYRNFVNKLWNIARYTLTTVKEPRLVEKRPKPKTLADEWILSELDHIVSETTRHLETYNFSLAGERVYEFTWSKFADWYLEVAKIEGDKDEILLYVLQNLLKLWHPFTPFITEHLWQMITGDKEEMLMVQEWPKADSKKESKAAHEFSIVRDVISVIRSTRQESGIAPAEKLPAVIIANKAQTKLLEAQQSTIMQLARLSEVTYNIEKPSQALSSVVSGIEIYLPVSGTIDIAKETSRLEKELQQVNAYISGQSKKLENKNFVDNAPKEIVESEKAKLEAVQEKAEKITKQLESLK